MSKIDSREKNSFPVKQNGRQKLNTNEWPSLYSYRRIQELTICLSDDTPLLYVVASVDEQSSEYHGFFLFCVVLLIDNVYIEFVYPSQLQLSDFRPPFPEAHTNIDPLPPRPLWMKQETLNRQEYDTLGEPLPESEITLPIDLSKENFQGKPVRHTTKLKDEVQ